jgi:hypothetical protein
MRRPWPTTWTLLGSAGRADPDRDAPLWRAGPYEKLKEVTRGKTVRAEDLHGLIRSLDIPQAEKDRLLAMTPASYTGKAAELARARLTGPRGGRVPWGGPTVKQIHHLQGGPAGRRH